MSNSPAASQLPSRFLVTECSKNAAFALQLPGNCTHFITGINKVNKTQAMNSLPHVLPPVSPQRLPHSLGLFVQSLNNAECQSYATKRTTW